MTVLNALRPRPHPDRLSGGIAALTLVATLAAVFLAVRTSPLLVFGALAAAGASVVAWNRPVVLLYAYSAAIPFNFALPPGPAGTVARIAGIVFFAGYIVRRPSSFRPNAIPLIGWLFVAWALASCLWAMDPNRSWASWLSLGQLFLITVLVARIVTEEPGVARTALWCFSLTAAATALWGSLSYLQSPTLFLARAAAFTDQDPALWASALLPAVVFLMAEIASPAADRRLRILAVPALMACAVALAVSGTRSAWLAAIVAVVAWIVVGRSPRQYLSLVAVVCALSVLVSAVPGMAQFLADRAGTSIASGGAGRTSIWEVGLSILAAAPIIGVGWANFPVAFSPYVIATSQAGSAMGIFAGRAPHNILLGTSVELGVVGALLLLVFFASAFLSPTRDRMTTLVRIGLLALLVQAMFLDVLLQKQLWLLLGIAFGLAARAGSAATVTTAVAEALGRPTDRSVEPIPETGGRGSRT